MIVRNPQDTVRVFEYMDGVALSLFHYAGQWRIITQGTYTSQASPLFLLL
jgi:hypothetical protein